MANKKITIQLNNLGKNQTFDLTGKKDEDLKNLFDEFVKSLPKGIKDRVNITCELVENEENEKTEKNNTKKKTVKKASSTSSNIG